MIVCLKGAENVVLSLKADKMRTMKWHTDAAHALHPDMRGHTGGAFSMGTGSVHNESSKKKSTLKAAQSLKQ